MFSFDKKHKINNYTVSFPMKKGDVIETYRVKDATGKNFFLKLINCARLHRTQFDSNGNILEIEITKQIKHPQLTKFSDQGSLIADGNKYAYIIFDYISGETVAQYVGREGACCVYEAKSIILGVLEGLNYLHSLPDPIIHNGINPQNVMLDASSHSIVPRIVGFGHARYLSQEVNAFYKKGLSTFYVAPEAINGVFSVKSDIFSVGALLFYLLFGLPPYQVDLSNIDNEGERKDLLDEHRKSPLYIPEPDKFELDDQLINIIKKALAFDIEDRFDSIEEIIKALNSEIQVESIDKKEEFPVRTKEQLQDSSSRKKGFTAIAGMNELKKKLQEEVIDALRFPEEYAKYGLTIPNGMLLYGPPGCGKTFFAKHLAEEVNFNFMVIKPSSLKSRFVNATQENIAQMFKDAEQKAPTIIFIDEINELVPNRDSDVHEMSKSAVNEMLAQMDRTGEKGIFIIGATNYPDMIDPAILRSGRLEKKYYIGAPDSEARRLMFELYLKSRPYDFGLDYFKLADLTTGYVSSDLEMIVNDAARIALKLRSKITMSILEGVIHQTKPSISKSELEKYERIKEKMES